MWQGETRFSPYHCVILINLDDSDLRPDQGLTITALRPKIQLAFCFLYKVTGTQPRLILYILPMAALGLQQLQVAAVVISWLAKPDILTIWPI